MVRYKHLIDVITILCLCYLWCKRLDYDANTNKDKDPTANDRLETIILVASFFMWIIMVSNFLWEIATGKSFWR